MKLLKVEISSSSNDSTVSSFFLHILRTNSFINFHYETMDEFVEKMKFAIVNKPKPLLEEVARIFTWEAASYG